MDRKIRLVYFTMLVPEKLAMYCNFTADLNELTKAMEIIKFYRAPGTSNNIVNEKIHKVSEGFKLAYVLNRVSSGKLTAEDAIKELEDLSIVRKDHPFERK